MLCFLAYAAVRLLLEILIVRGRSSAGLRAEVLSLRHQLRVLERQGARPRWRPADRFRSEGVQVIRLPYRSPRANAFADTIVSAA